MKFYSSIIPNTDNSENFIGTKKAFIDYLNAFKVYETPTNKQFFILTDTIRISNNSFLTKNAYNISYIYDDLTEYFFQVKSCTILKDTVIFDVVRDTWAMEVLEHAKDIKNINITKSNLFLGLNGIYDPISATINKPTYNKLFKDYTQPKAVKMGVAFVASINFESKIEGKSIFTSQIRTYGFTNAKLLELQAELKDESPLPEFAIKFISGISIYNQQIDGTFKSQDFKVLKAYLIDEDLINVKTYGDYCTTVFNGVDHLFFALYLTPGIKNKSFQYNGASNKEAYAGTLTSNLKITRTNNNLSNIVYQCVTKQNGLEIKVMQGDNQLDITKSFEVIVTTNEGLITSQEQTERSLMNLAGLISSAGSIMKGGFGGISGGIMTGLNTMYNLAKGNSNGSYTPGGDGLSTFTIDEMDFLPFTPYYTIEYEALIDVDFNTALFGLNYDFIASSLDKIANTEYIDEAKQIIEDYDGRIIIPKLVKGKAYLLDAFTLDTQNLINSRLDKGLKLKFL